MLPAQPQPAPPDLLTLSHQHPIVLFDGVCNFCDATINFLIQKDIQARLRFVPLQEPAGQALLRHLSMDTETFDTFLLLDHGRVYQRSTAGLRVLRYLPGAWPWLYGLILIPTFVRDAVYQIIARNRYRWFGRTDACMIPDASVRGRFL
jgi:predicted DCC family thiol-disulfide oxidoreductase YuxK